MATRHSPCSTTLRGDPLTQRTRRTHVRIARTHVRGVCRGAGGYVYVYVVCCVLIFVAGSQGGGRVEAGGFVSVPLGHGVGLNGWYLYTPFLRWLGLVSYHAERDVGLFGSTRFFSPPKFCFTPEPVCLNTKRRRQSSVPFSGHYPVRSSDASQAVVRVEESTRLGSVFLGFVVRLST